MAKGVEVIFLTARENRGQYMLEISGTVYGKIVGNDINSVCKKYAESNAAPKEHRCVYIDESGFGNEFADELENYFKIHIARFKSRKFFTKA